MRKNLIFKIISLTLILSHLSTFCFHDLSFAMSADDGHGHHSRQSRHHTNERNSDASASSEIKSSASGDTVSQAESKAMVAMSSSSGSIPPVSISGLSNFNLAALQSFQNDLFTGRATFSVPIAAPAGRRGMQPNLALSYSSGSGNGIVAVGWGLELGAIERSTKKGPPKYDSTDKFIFNGAGGQAELVNIGGNEYRAKIEGSFMKFTFNGTCWLVTDKNGNKNYFGQTSSSRQENGSRVFKWCFDKVIDLKGNYSTVTYTKDQNQIYPSQIQYAGNDNTSLSPCFTVEFVFESSRPDIFSSFRPGFKVVTTKRLSDVKVKFNDALVRGYKLNFTTSNLNQSLLASVTQYDKSGSTLPAVTFQYQAQNPGWQLSAKQVPSTYGSFDWTTTLLDVNNDGFTDFMTNNGNTTYLGKKDGSWQEASTWKLPYTFTNGYGDCGWRLGDINSDGWIDLINHVHSDGGGSQPAAVYINNKTNGWDYDAGWSAKVPCEAYFIYNHDGGGTEWHEMMGWILTDINGDGLVDFVRARENHEVYLNTGSGWVRNSGFDTPSGTSFTDNSTQSADINGDGLPDLVIARSDSKVVFINTGSGWLQDTAQAMPGDPAINFTDNSTQLVDINADGLADVVVASGSQKRAFINKGVNSSGGVVWQENASFALPDGDFTQYATRLADTKGKYLFDILINSSGTNKVYTNKNTLLPALLTKISNGIGGETTVTYTASTEFDNTGVSGKCELPFPIYVVDTVTTHESINPANSDTSSSYEYQKGMFDFQERELCGFGYVKAIDIEGNFSESYFYQDKILKGRPYLQQTKDSSGNLYAKTNNAWTSSSIYPGVNFVYLTQTDNFVYDGASYKQTQVKFEYDSYGNPSKVTSYGDVSTTGDEKAQITEYNYNTSDWVLSLPKHTYLLDDEGYKVSEKWFYYDNSLLTKEESWLYNPLAGSEEKVASEYTYDQNGNVLTFKDALGRITTTAYDTLLYTYPVQVTNAQGQTAKSVYYGINEDASDGLTGSGLVGQVKFTTDPNQQKVYNIYDTWGRLVKTFGPNDTEAKPGVSYEYNLTSQPIKVTRSVKANYNLPPGYLTTYQFFDGLGRVIETKSPAENDPATGQTRQIISDITILDQRGQVKEKYLPYFVNSSTSYVAPSYNTPHNSLTYDALGRITQSTNPDSTYSSISYSNWVKTTTDENSNYKTEYYDAYGRIIKIEEHNSGQTYTTLYEYDCLGNLIKVTDNQNNITQIWYDSFGRKIKMNDPDMGVWSYEYDKLGNLTKQTDAKAQVLTFNYDALNRLTTKLASGLAIVNYSYDDVVKQNCIGRLSKITDQSGSTEFFYDNQGREIKSVKKVEGTSYAAERSYDALDRLLILKYPDNSSVKYEYNPQGITKVTNGSNLMDYISNIDYSPTGQIIKIEYGNGTETNYTYNPNTLRLTNLTTQSPFGKIQDLNYQFDNAGNVTQLTDYVNTASQTFQYDDLNRLTNATGAYGSFNYTYDSIGNMISKEGVSLTYGKSGKLPHAVTKFGSTSIDYDSNGNMIKKGDLSLSYDAENRLIKTEGKAIDPGPQPASVTLNLKPGWNFVSLPLIPADSSISAVFSAILGKISQISRYNNLTKKFDHWVNNSKYDQFANLEYGQGYQIYISGAADISLKISGTLPNTEQSIFLKSGSNLVFNPKTTETDVETALSPLQLGVDYSKVLFYNKSLNQFQEYSSSKKEFTKLTPGTAYYLYALKDATWNIAPPPPAEITITSTYLYDGDGGRVKKTTGSNSTVYIGSLFEIDSSGIATKHIFAGANRVCAVDSAGAQSYYHSDHLGSSNVITDATGKQTGLTEFTPYGSVSKQTGSYNPKYKFTGKELDTSGLYFYGARYMDPQLGRFITADTVVQSPYDPQSLNRYSYCRNNPINYVDPTGHSFWSKFWKSFVGAFVGAIATVIAGPIGLNLVGWTMAGIIGGSTAGAITGGLEGGWQGALMGAGIGGALGGLGGWGVAQYGVGFAVGMLVAGAGVAGATDSWASFAGGLTGGIAGGLFGGGIVNSKQFQSWKVQKNGLNKNRAWVGYGYGETADSDTKSWVQQNFSDEYEFFSNNPKVDFIENPSWGDFTKAMKSSYKAVGLDIHGGPQGLVFADGTHSLSELSSISSQINVGEFGLVACYPGVHTAAWNSLNISTTNFVDLSVPISRFRPYYTDARKGIGDLKYFTESRLDN